MCASFFFLFFFFFGGGGGGYWLRSEWWPDKHMTEDAIPLCPPTPGTAASIFCLLGVGGGGGGGGGFYLLCLGSYLMRVSVGDSGLCCCVLCCACDVSQVLLIPFFGQQDWKLVYCDRCSQVFIVFSGVVLYCIILYWLHCGFSCHFKIIIKGLLIVYGAMF